MTKIHIDEDIKRIRKLHQSTLSLDKAKVGVGEFLSLQASRILTAQQSGDTSVKFHLACWFPPLLSRSVDEIMQHPLTIEQAQQTIAAEHGFKNWAAVSALHNTAFDGRFESAVDTMLSGDFESLRKAIGQSPTIVNQRSQYGHQATLLHYLGANGVESYRQVTPLNAVELVKLLVDHGADVNAVANIYGGSKPSELIMSSAHPHNAGVAESMAAVLYSGK